MSTTQLAELSLDPCCGINNVDQKIKCVVSEPLDPKRGYYVQWGELPLAVKLKDVERYSVTVRRPNNFSENDSIKVYVGCDEGQITTEANFTFLDRVRKRKAADELRDQLSKAKVVADELENHVKILESRKVYDADDLAKLKRAKFLNNGNSFRNKS
jgi:hypothetical protein